MSVVYQKRKNKLIPVTGDNADINDIQLNLDAGVVKSINYDQLPEVTSLTYDNNVDLNFKIPQHCLETTSTAIRYDYKFKIIEENNLNKTIFNFYIPKAMIAQATGINLYTENKEYLVGSWNGKYIYRKYFRISDIISSKILDELPIYEKVLDFVGFLTLENSTVHTLNWDIISLEVNQEHQLVIDEIIDNVKELEIGVDFIKNNDVLSYRKTYPHDYVETEEIVGTWIDGRPVYKKVFHTTSSTVFTDETDIETIIKTEGVVRSGTTWYALNIGTASRGVHTSTNGYWLKYSYKLYTNFNPNSGNMSITVETFTLNEAYVFVYYIKKSDLIPTE